MNIEDFKDFKNLETQTPEICREAVKQDGFSLQYVREQTPEICLEAVKQDGYALPYVREQTPEICLAAVKQNGDALQYVHEQTPEICLAAVRENGYALAYVREQTREICLEAVKQNGDAIGYVQDLEEMLGVLPSKNFVSKGVCISETFDIIKRYGGVTGVTIPDIVEKYAQKGFTTYPRLLLDQINKLIWEDKIYNTTSKKRYRRFAVKTDINIKR